MFKKSDPSQMIIEDNYLNEIINLPKLKEDVNKAFVHPQHYPNLTKGLYSLQNTLSTEIDPNEYLQENDQHNECKQWICSNWAMVVNSLTKDDLHTLYTNEMNKGQENILCIKEEFINALSRYIASYAIRIYNGYNHIVDLDNTNDSNEYNYKDIANYLTDIATGSSSVNQELLLARVLKIISLSNPPDTNNLLRYHQIKKYELQDFYDRIPPEYQKKSILQYIEYLFSKTNTHKPLTYTELTSLEEFIMLCSAIRLYSRIMAIEYLIGGICYKPKTNLGINLPKLLASDQFNALQPQDTKEYIHDILNNMTEVTNKEELLRTKKYIMNKFNDNKIPNSDAFWKQIEDTRIEGIIERYNKINPHKNILNSAKKPEETDALDHNNHVMAIRYNLYWGKWTVIVAVVIFFILSMFLVYDASDMGSKGVQIGI
ncbi:hypothetical protein NEOKW01_0676 [Nematocida sp. AWRm80]|nr:hypothetical protein NEOKW01_0676 [Nematocida sp. AWRm80]